jgi:hypothetical protein
MYLTGLWNTKRELGQLEQGYHEHLESQAMAA